MVGVEQTYVSLLMPSTNWLRQVKLIIHERSNQNLECYSFIRIRWRGFLLEYIGETISRFKRDIIIDQQKKLNIKFPLFGRGYRFPNICCHEIKRNIPFWKLKHSICFSGWYIARLQGFIRGIIWTPTGFYWTWGKS